MPATDSYTTSQTSANSTGQVIQFPRSSLSRSASSDPFSSLLDTSLASRDASVLEGQLGELAIRYLLERVSTEGSFDPIYISRLQPDPLLSADLRLLQKLARIEDRSGEILFDDGMDD